MSAIAKVMLEMGYQVSGSDLAQQELTEKLAAKGAQVFIGHEAQNVKERTSSYTLRRCPKIT